MKYIRTNKDGTIHLIADKEQPNTVAYSGKFPYDFYQTFSKGKYLFVDGEIVENAYFNESGLPRDIPHRTILITEGIRSIKDLPEDLTTIGGIGKSKADDIINYNK